jgi:hypothetical protein
MTYVFGFIGFIVAVVAILFIPSKQPEAPAPWEIIIKDDGNPQVFDIHIGHSNLADAQRAFREQAEVAIFENEASEKLSAEAYFESINLGGLSAKVVLNLAVTQSAMKIMIGRAQEGRIQNSGARKYQLNPIDAQALLAAPIYALTYIPSFVKLDESILTSRFGKPYKQETVESKSIWHYPNTGLTAQFSENEKSLLQYKVVNSAQLTFDAENQSSAPSQEVD